ncbi:uncharacterized protein L3040_009137 [Drepanopeziza brunnea f. sp. 'multigermtubi']|uniref:uncharacterized protein n=1 Tax=Drepanopeziza brunnea f. sp. 'multigermtubi' TaxID=698441 RepID=UPI002386966F|nr:hypothetical protein L3040_009137 [Drepanopeziza brunnea f. sp. 'multigermtubi']
MGPPMPAGYSLRVQLFAPDAYDSSDKPIRNFRVVASPDCTVEEFCLEASRIHQMNYGTPLSLKKVQDDQQFDITQGEILGNLFTSMSTIRCIQASSVPGARDSVAPNSALRFDPAVSLKRERDGVPRANGSTPGNSWSSNKRRRVADPDEPLPSRENIEVVHESPKTNGHIPDLNVVPNSQESVILGNPEGPFKSLRHVRITSLPKTVNEIRETPPPIPPPALILPSHERGSADHKNRQPDNDTTVLSHSSPLAQEPVRAQSQTSNQRAKSANYHVQRATERGTSVSAAATSPMSIEQRPIQNGVSSTSHRRQESRPTVLEKSGRSGQRNEDSIYDVITTDDEKTAISRAKNSATKTRNSPNSGLSGPAWAKNKFSTPPNGNRRSSASREQSTPGELPMTPNSKQREERQNPQADEIRKARIAAAEAADLRRRETKEAREVEERRKAEEERAKREEQEQIEVENFQRGEAERKASATKAALLKKEQEVVEEERRREQARIANEKAEAEKRVQEERLAQDKAAIDEAQRLRAVDIAAEELRKSNEALKQKEKTHPPENSREPKSHTPILPPSRTPSSNSNVQSSTPFIPGGRKSALKHSASSQALRSSSPAGSRESADESLPKSVNRRVSFRDEHERKETPVMPPTRIVSKPKTSTPVTVPRAAVTPQAQHKAVIPRSETLKGSAPAPHTAVPTGSAPKPSQVTPIPPPVRKYTPIPLPPTISSLGRKITPIAQKKATLVPKDPTPPEPTRKGTPVPEIPVARKSVTPGSQSTSKMSPPAKNSARKSITPAPEVSSRKSTTLAPVAKGKSKSVQSELESMSVSSNSSDGSDEDIPSRRIPEKPSFGLNGLKRAQPVREASRNQDVSDSEEDVDMDKGVDEEETQSHDSRGSRSPVVFTQHSSMGKPSKPRRSVSPESEDGSEFEASEDEQEDSDSDMGGNRKRIPRAKNQFVIDKANENVSSEDDSDAAEDDGDEEQDAEEDIRHSSPHLPRHKKFVKASPEPNGRGQSNSHSMIPESSAIVYPPTSSIAPRPAIKFGTSLSSLTRNRSALATSSAIQAPKGRSGQRTQLLADDEDSEDIDDSEEESSSDSSESDDDAVKTVAQNSRSKEPAQVTVYSDSDSSESESEEQKQAKKARNQLSLEIAALQTSDSGIPSPKLYNMNTQQLDTGKENKRRTSSRKVGNLTSGYKFNL